MHLSSFSRPALNNTIFFLERKKYTITVKYLYISYTILIKAKREPHKTSEIYSRLLVESKHICEKFLTLTNRKEEPPTYRRGGSV